MEGLNLLCWEDDMSLLVVSGAGIGLRVLLFNALCKDLERCKIRRP